MSSINNNFLINLINTGNIDLSNMQNLVDDTKGELFNLDSSTISSDSFISTSGSATFNNSASPQISSTTADATQYEKEIKELDEKIQQYEKLIEQYTKELEALEAELEATEQKIKTSENELESLKAQQSAKEDEYARVKTTLSQAENTNKDGSNDAFITNLNSQLQNISAELFVIQSNIFTKTSQIAAYQLQATTIEDSIASVEEKLSNTETLKTTAELQKTDTETKLNEVKETIAATATGAATGTFATTKLATDNAKTDTKVTNTEELMSLLPDQENDFIQDLIDKGCLDLSEKLDDGSPRYTRYIFAQTEDGKYCYVTRSPLSFDLNGDGVKTSDELIQYDIDGDGKLDTINDSADAILVFDADGDGISGEDGSECFGDNTDLDGDGVADGYKDGFEALKALANKEGLVDGVNDNTLDVDDLKILEEKYGLQIKTDGYNSEASSLFDAGITEINLATTDETTLHKNYDGQHNDLMTQEGATFVVNGEEREYADIWHAKKDE